jgi:hypothetical protein
MVISQDQHAGQHHNIKISNKSFERLEKFKYLGTTLTDHYSIHEEIKSRLKSENAYYHSNAVSLPSCFLYKNIKTRFTEL